MHNALRNLLQLLTAKKYQLSLAILIPVFLVLFAFGPLYVALIQVEGMVAAGASDPTAFPAALQKTEGLLRIVLWVSVAAAATAGLALAYSILSPLKKFALDSRLLIGDRGKAEKEFTDELGILGKDISMMMSSLGRHIAILEAMSGGVIAFDRDGRVTAVNPTAERLFARQSPDLLGRPLSEVCRRIVQSPDMERVVLDGLRQGKAYSSQEVRISIPGRKDIVAGLTTSLLTSVDGQTAGLVANFMDLTSISEMHQDLQRKLRMAGLGRLAAGVAHEIRNPLGAIKGMAQLIQEGSPDSDQRKKYAVVIEDETDRLNKVVEDLLGLVHGATERVSCDINALLAQARDLASQGMGERQLRLPAEAGDIPVIQGERGRLMQAFLNIFLNAFEAVPDNGGVRYRTSYRPSDGMVTVEIGNTGTRIAPEVRERMFEPFFSTKEKGSGLGLSIAHQIIAAHGGSITAESSDEETVIQVLLPARG
jgi:PAS domain S-box-containing protein